MAPRKPFLPLISLGFHYSQGYLNDVPLCIASPGGHTYIITVQFFHCCRIDRQASLDGSLQVQLILPLPHYSPSESSWGELMLALHSGVGLLSLSLLCFPSCMSHSGKAEENVNISSHVYGEETCLSSPRCQSVLSVRRA